MRWIHVLVLLLVAGPVAAQTMSDFQVRTLVSEYERQTWAARRDAEQQGKPSKWEDEARLSDQALAGVTLAALSPAQLFLLADRGLLAGSHRGEGAALLNKAREGEDAGAALAALGYVNLLRIPADTPEAVAEAFRAALTHRGLANAVRTAGAYWYFSDVSTLIANRKVTLDSARLGDFAAILRLEPGLPMMSNLSALVDRLETHANATSLDPGKLEAFRGAALAALRNCRKQMDDERSVRDLSEAMGNSPSVKSDDLLAIRAYAAGKLQELERRLERTFGRRAVGKPAPELALRWVVGREEVSELAAERGHAVVLVKWYRWPEEGSNCGVAILKELAKTYAGKPVTIVALTSFLQGQLVGTKGVIDPGGTREAQIADIRAAAAAQGVTTPIAVIRENQLKTNLGIEFAGDAVVIDDAGTVRAVFSLTFKDEDVFRAIDEVLKGPPGVPPGPP
jgi:hypothetical protein